MRKIAITGISGYIGTRLLSRLNGLDEVEKIVGIDTRKPEYSSLKLKFYRQDISQPMGDIFVENEVDSAVHLAFVLKPTHDLAGARQTDVGGMSNFLASCQKAKVKQILYLSSHTVYGAHPDNAMPLKEDSPLRPLSGFQYSRDKAEAEKILRHFGAANKDVIVTILRSCPVIGPNARRSVAALMFKPPVIIGVAGYDPPMQFVHEDDLLDLIALFLKHQKAGIFNVAGDGELRYSEIAGISGRRMLSLPEKLLRLLMGFSWAFRFQNDSPTSGLEFIKYPPIVSTEKLKKETGFRFRYSTKEALLSLLSAIR